MFIEEKPVAYKRPRNPGGRPTKYKPASCEIAIELGRQGLSRTHIACEFGTTKDVLADWERDHPEFSSAMGVAGELSEKWWIDKGTEGMLAGPGSFNAAIWSRSDGGAILSKLMTDLGTSMERLEIEKRLAAVEERLGSKR